MASFVRQKKSRAPPVTPTTQLIELLPGEIAVALATKAQQVLYFTERAGYPWYTVAGTLLCTNYRVCFIPYPEAAERLPAESLAPSKNVPLGCIREISMLNNRSRKMLDGRTSLPKRITEIELLCKDLRKLVFSIKNSPKSEASSLVNAIARHSNPSTPHLLFAFDYTRAIKDWKRKDSLGSGAQDIPSFLNAIDWQRELHRLNVTNDQWRVTEANRRFLVCDSLGPYFVCPTSYSDSALENAAGLHTENRIPVWCWSHPHTGISLTMGGLVTIDDPTEAPDPQYMTAISMARHTEKQVENKRIAQINATKTCGTVKDVFSGFTHMKELCTPNSGADLFSLDKKWYSSLESSGWMALVRSCLVTAKEVTISICVKRKSAMLLEETGRDLNCVVASLVQLMADPHFRSISGFETLVQKCWVSMGHPFTSRLALVVGADMLGLEQPLEEAPVFLLFLNCVWQLSKQFPSAFEFSESFLLHLYDMMQTCLYSNFIFDSPKRRLQATLYSRKSCFFGNVDEPMEQEVDDYEGPLLSAWGRWREQMNKEETEACLNPFYYIFGSGDAHFDYSKANKVPVEQSRRLSMVFNDSIPTLTVAGAYGLYKNTKELSPAPSIISDSYDYFKEGLLVPETSMCSLKVWGGFFFRYLRELSNYENSSRKAIHTLESRMVRNVRKLKDELNELELSLGTYTSDLTSFIGEALQAREKELEHDRKLSVDLGPQRPRLSAVVYAYDEADGLGMDDSLTLSGDVPLPGHGNSLRKPSTSSQSGHRSSLATFTDALYSSELEDSSSSLRSKLLAERSASVTGSSSSVGRSPVIKTRLRVVKSKASDPVVAAWQNSPRQQSRHTELLTDKILTRKASDTEKFTSSSNELTEL